MPEFQDLLALSEEAARAGANELMAWRGRFQTQEKSVHDLVTDADLASQQAIQAVILKHFPEHGFLGEESADLEQLQMPYCWVVDPLDGTTNYVHGFPCYAVSVAVAQHGEVVAGCIYDPISKECFLASAGQGSSLNGETITTSSTEDVAEALVAVSFPPQTTTDSPDIQAFLRVAPRCQAIRRTGSAALNLAYVACGRLDAHWAHHIHPWDSAAGTLLVKEAGGIVRASNGHSYQLAEGNYFVSGTPNLYETLLPLVIGQ